MNQGLHNLFNRMDTNNDGVVDKNEFQNAVSRGLTAYAVPKRPAAHTKKPSTKSAVPDHVMSAFGVRTDGSPVDFNSFLQVMLFISQWTRLTLNCVQLVSATVTPAESLASSAFSTPMISQRSWASGTFTGPGAVHSARVSYSSNGPPVTVESKQSKQPTQLTTQQSQPTQQALPAQPLPSTASALKLNSCEERDAIAAFACLTGCASKACPAAAAVSLHNVAVWLALRTVARGSESINLEQWMAWAAQCPAAIHAMAVTANQNSVSVPFLTRPGPRDLVPLPLLMCRPSIHCTSMRYSR